VQVLFGRKKKKKKNLFWKKNQKKKGDFAPGYIHWE
jgi:hypothetical protein